MAFRVSARTVLELGAELISSDAIAIYELIKNAIDAGSEDGIEIHFSITIGHSSYVECLAELEEGKLSLDELRAGVRRRCEATATADQVRQLMEALEEARSARSFERAFRDAYATTSWIEFRDTGKGMSKNDLLERYLVIGTPSRKLAVEAAITKGDKEVPYLGEKGVGRLSVMRLGGILKVETATCEDKRLNNLEIDWNRFDDDNLNVEDIKIAPTAGGPKASIDWSGTTIRVSALTSSWSEKRLSEMAKTSLARIVDPFLKKRRFRIGLYYNGERLEIPFMDDRLLAAAHAWVKADYKAGDKPRLHVEMSCKDEKGRSHNKALTLQRPDIWSVVNDADEKIAVTTLRTVGPFELEAYWYNRRQLIGIESIGDRTEVRALQKRWSGIMVFRDEYRVAPYGNEEDDWLGLDRKALGSPGYKLNKIQFVGRVSISRVRNPRLRDQTNREGLQHCAETFFLKEVLGYVIQELLHGFMDQVKRRHESIDDAIPKLEDRISSLEKRAKEAVQTLVRRHKESSLELKDVQAIFAEMRGYFDQARDLALQAEDERVRLIQLAGVGLMLEVVAHELARSTEHALGVLLDTELGDQIPAALAGTLRNLRGEMQTMNKRLRVLDPLSVSARQKRETFDLGDVIKDSLAGHEAQFARHSIKVDVRSRKVGRPLTVKGVKGMFIQIIENLVSNSVFWMAERRKEEKTYSPRIDVTIDPGAEQVIFADNGPGIDVSLRDDVFKAFFSTKDRKRRQGLGLYIARECAKYNNATLDLSDERAVHNDRLNTFVLQLNANDNAE